MHKNGVLNRNPRIFSNLNRMQPWRQTHALADYYRDLLTQMGFGDQAFTGSIKRTASQTSTPSKTPCAKAGLTQSQERCDPETVLRLADVAHGKGINLLEAPVTGGRKGAEDQQLCYIVGGERDVLEKCRDIFSSSGSHIFHTGSLGTASTVKIILQAVVCINMLAASEAETLCQQTGIDFPRFAEILHVSSGQSFVLDNWIERFKRPQDPTSTRQHRAEVFKKSLSPALLLAQRLGISVPGASLARERFDHIMGITSKDQKTSSN